MYKMNRRHLLLAALVTGGPLLAAVAVTRLAKYQQRKSRQVSPWSVPESAPALLPATPEAIARAFPEDSRATLEAGEMTLLSVSPGYADFEEARTGKKVVAYHRRPILGSVVLTEDEKRLVLASLDDELAPRDEPRSMTGAQCFEPRHGARAVDAATGKRVDLLICFSCHNAHLYRGKAGDSEENDTQDSFYAFGPAANYHLNGLLRKHGLPLAP
jgi:hypothetical protein